MREATGTNGVHRGSRRKRALWRGVGVAGIVAVIAAASARMTGCAERLFYYPIAADDLEAPAGAEDVFFESEGLTLHGWFLPAEGVTGGELAPTIVHCHGNANNIGRHLPFVEFLPRAGFNVFLFDYRSYGRSEAGPLRRDRVIADARAAIDAVMAREDVDPDRVGVYGLSLGGTIALAAAAEDARVRAVCSVATFSAWRDVAGDHAGWIGRVLIRDGRDARDSAAALGERPLLLVHGTADGIVPYRHGPIIRDAALAAGVAAELVTLDGAGHIDWVDGTEARRAITTFFGRVLAHTPDG